MESHLSLVLVSSLYLLHFLFNSQRVPLDPDAASHLRLAQLWKLGSRPLFSYRIGVKIGLPLIYRLAWRLLSPRYERHRLINYAGLLISHYVIYRFVSQPVELLAHIMLVLVALSPLSFVTTSSLDFVLGPTIILSSIFLSESGASGLSTTVFLLVILFFSVFWKISNALFAVVPLLLVAGTPMIALSLVLFSLAFSAVVGKILLGGARALPSILAYRQTRGFFRVKTLVPNLIFLTLFSPLLYFLWQNPPSSGLEKVLATVVLVGLSHNIITGDWLTGSASTLITIPLIFLGTISSDAFTASLTLFLLVSYHVATFIGYVSVGPADTVRLLSVGARFPVNIEKAKREAAALRSLEPQAAEVLFLTDDAAMSLYSGIKAVSGFPYNSNHTKFWGVEGPQLVGDHLGSLTLVAKPEFISGTLASGSWRKLVEDEDSHLILDSRVDEKQFLV